MIKTSGSIWPKITLYSPNGETVKSDYSSSNSEISTELPITGTYTIIAENGYTTSAYTGDYSIFTQRTSSGSISEPASTISPESTQYVDTQNSHDSQTSIIFPLLFIGLVLIAIFSGAMYRNKKKKENEEQIKKSNQNNPGENSSVGLPSGPKDEPKEHVSKVAKHDVFISYSSEDKTIADATCANLESKGIRCWIAPRDVLPGKNYQGEIIDAIDNTHIMVLIFSSNSNKSPYIIRELTGAVENDVVIIPFRIENVLPSKSMKFLINVPHWLDAMTPPLEQHLEKLAETIQLFLDKKIETGEE